MARLVKRKSKLTGKISWVTELTIADVHKRTRVNHGQKTEREAQVLHSALVLRMAQLGPSLLHTLEAAQKRRSIGAAWADMIDREAGEGASEKSLIQYRIRRAHVCRILGVDTPLAAVSRESLSQYVAQRGKDGVKPRTIQGELKTFLKLLRHEYEEGRLPAIPRAPKLGRAIRRTTAPIEALTDVEIAAIERELPLELSHQWILAICTGVRRDEISHLEWSRVGLSSTPPVATFIDVKYDNLKEIRLHPDAVRALSAQREALVRTSRMGRLVFPGRDGTKPRTQWSPTLRRALKRAGIDRRVYLHLCRHTVATRLLALGYSTIEVMRIMHWRSTSIVELYAHASSERIADAFERLPGASGAAPKVLEFRR